MPAKGVTGLSEYSMGRFTMKVMLPHPLPPPWPDKRSASLPAFYCIIWVQRISGQSPGVFPRDKSDLKPTTAAISSDLTYQELSAGHSHWIVEGTSGNPFSTAVAVSMIGRARCLNAPDPRRDFASECRIATSHASAAALWGHSALPARGEVKSSARGGFQRRPSPWCDAQPGKV